MDIREAREEIRKIDDEMAKLFIRRMEAAVHIAEHKRERGLPVDDPRQEQMVIDEHSRLIEDDTLRSYYLGFIRHTMDVSKKWQHRLMEGQKVACCGEAGSDDWRAAERIFPEGTACRYGGYEEAYAAVESGECDVAVLPFENGYGGEVGHVIDLIFGGSLHVNAIYDLEGEITDHRKTRRYAVLSRVESTMDEGSEPTALLLMFTVRDETGGLAKAINIISAFDYNMRIMRSRPMRDLPWHYYFYAEAVGDNADVNSEGMINALRVICPVAKAVGRYPASRLTIDIGE